MIEPMAKLLTLSLAQKDVKLPVKIGKPERYFNWFLARIDKSGIMLGGEWSKVENLDWAELLKLIVSNAELVLGSEEVVGAFICMSDRMFTSSGEFKPNRDRTFAVEVHYKPERIQKR